MWLVHLYVPSLNRFLPFNDQFGFTQFAISTAVGSASTLLMLRTIAVWNRAPLITVPLVVASLGQWALLFHSVVIVAGAWNDIARTCLITSTSPLFIGLIYLYSELIISISRWMGQNKTPNNNVGRSDVVGLDCLGAHSDWTAHVSWTIFTLASSFSTGYYLLPCRIHCQRSPYRFCPP